MPAVAALPLEPPARPQRRTLVAAAVAARCRPAGERRVRKPPPPQPSRAQPLRRSRQHHVRHRRPWPPRARGCPPRQPPLPRARPQLPRLRLPWLHRQPPPRACRQHLAPLGSSPGQLASARRQTRRRETGVLGLGPGHLARAAASPPARPPGCEACRTAGQARGGAVAPAPAPAQAQAARAQAGVSVAGKARCVRMGLPSHDVA